MQYYAYTYAHMRVVVCHIVTIHMYTCTYAYIRIHIIHMRRCVLQYVVYIYNTCVYICICIHVYMYTYVRIIHMRTFVYICMCAYAYICIHACSKFVQMAQHAHYHGLHTISPSDGSDVIVEDSLACRPSVVREWRFLIDSENETEVCAGLNGGDD